MDHLQIHYRFMLLHDHKFTYSSDLFSDIFCVSTQSSDAMGLIFHAKITLCFISNI